MFSRELVDRLVRSLEEHPLPHLTPSEMEHLIVLIQTTVEVSGSKRLRLEVIEVADEILPD